MMQFRKLSRDEEALFRTNARAVYQPFTPIDGVWHPVYQAECVRMNAEAGALPVRFLKPAEPVGDDPNA